MATRKFSIEVEMEERWIPHFVTMLKTMERLGNIGSSRYVGFMSDGDGNFRPKFTTDMTICTDSILTDCKVKSLENVLVFDAG